MGKYVGRDQTLGAGRVDCERAGCAWMFVLVVYVCQIPVALLGRSNLVTLVVSNGTNGSSRTNSSTRRGTFGRRRRSGDY